MPTVTPLPTYPSAGARKSLSASQLAIFHRNLSSALAEILALPPAKRDTPSTRAFLSSYANDIAHQTLQSLIWQAPAHSDDHVHRRALLLAEKLANVPSCIDVKMLLDIAIAYFPYPTRVRALFAAALASTPSLATVFSSDMVPVMTTLLSPSGSAGLYGLRKTARCLVSLLSGCPSELLRPFARDQDFMIGLAQAYDEGLASLARSYGGMRTDVGTRELDDWERIWLETKVDLIDSFHIIITVLLQDLSVASGAALAAESERTFSIIFALLDLPPARIQAGGTPASTPFLSRSLMADYQHSYNLSSTLTSALRRPAREDARVDLLESTLRSFDIESSTAGTKDPGALKLILKSSGVPPGTSASGNGKAARSSSMGKAIEVHFAFEPEKNHDLDLQISQVMDIFPDKSPGYIRALLAQPAFGNAEKVIEALLEGTAPGEASLAQDVSVGNSARAIFNEPIERRNVFDDEILDVSKIHVGKRNQDDASVLRDREAIEQMKADILRRAEAMSDGEEEEDGGKPAEVDDDLDFGGEVKVVGDGEASSEGEDDGDEEPPKLNPETILELAYIRDAELFNRDANTRRSKARIDLKAQTGKHFVLLVSCLAESCTDWSDEQIEGWKIMLERNPNKDKILQKHEFSGNRAGYITMTGDAGGSGPPSRGGDRGRGRGGRGAGRGRGRGRGAGDGGDAKERAWKDKNKASRGNHNRKRGHDKKMANAGPS
ncbi:uncharacterized protein EDB91DRAFT_1234067 [Suillus paluster]|uniref:uncharacterized protein n=1 Tax=Suillus paluster TaxID=48578 RepID=UPI001B85FC5B|nr:uncharacterized protein EDB91DRAFT_1234067 [Suillus paluster]KAG1753611.1 hypothetical protein EDB91DRAFT_1234067 [Suillus paluster]